MRAATAVLLLTIVSISLVSSLNQQSFTQTSNYSPKWQKNARPNQQTELCFHAALKHNAADAIDQKFWKVSMPDSKEYGKHLSMDEVTNLIGVPQQSVDAVMNWFQSVPNAKVSAAANRDMVHACMPASSAEQLMGTEFHQYQHQHSKHTGYRASSPLNVPSNIANLLDFIGGANTPIHRFTPQVRSAMDHTKAPMAPNLPAGPFQAADAPSMRQVSKEEPESKIAPRLTLIIGGYQEVAVHFVALCSDGSANADLDTPCSSRPPYVDSFELLVSTEGHGERVLTVPPSACNGPACVITVDQIRNYQQITVRVNTKYADGSYSGFSRRSYVVYATDYATPSFLKNLYGIPSELRVKNKASTQSVAEFLEQYYSQDDLDMYLHDMGIERQIVTRLIGPNNETEGSISGGESQLDIQVMMGVAPGADTWFWSVPGRQHHTHQEPFLHWIMQVANTSDAPLVHSVSYADDELSYELWYIQRMDVEFQKMGLRGMTVLVASGDDGIGTGDSRPAPGVTKRTDCDRSHPGYPSSSPYVLSIGGTQLTDAGSPMCTRTTHGLKMTCSNLREKGCSAASGGVITSGGGFSNIFPRPAYQHDVVEKYLRAPDVKLPPHFFFNRSGRGYPDISAYSSNYITIMGREVALSSGTSASTPLIAAMITFWNDLLISSGMPPVGFFNPRLYQIAAEHPEAFNDVVIGDNSCGIYGVDCCPYGFEAHAGWDPITGLGSPRFNEITTILLAPKNPFPWVTGIDATVIAPSSYPSTNTILTLLATLAVLLAGFAVYKVTKLGSDHNNYHGHSHSHGGAEKERLLPKYGTIQGDSR